MLKLKQAIITRQSVSVTSIQDVGAFSADGKRDVTLWVKGIDILPGPGDSFNALTPPGTARSVIVHTLRAGRSDEELRILAAKRFFEMTGAELTLIFEEPAPKEQPKPEPAAPTIPRRAKDKE